MEGKPPRGRPKLRWKDTVRRDLKAWNIREEWATDRERWEGLCKTRYPAQRKVRNPFDFIAFMLRSKTQVPFYLLLHCSDARATL